MKIAVLLHNIRSAHNVGSIFRTADAAGIRQVYLTGYTPTPRDRFGRSQKEIAKIALGAECTLPWSQAAELKPLIARLKREGWLVVGVEQDSRARDYRAFRAKKPTLFIFGNEVHGLSRAARDLCDELIEIPMYGNKESLNVSVAAGVILFSVR